MSLPPSRMRPSSGVSKPASIRNSVVLPQPLGPSSAKNSPARISSERLSTARKLPNDLATPSMRSRGMSGAAGSGNGLAASALASPDVTFFSPDSTPVRQSRQASGGSPPAQPLRGATPAILSACVSLLHFVSNSGGQPMKLDRYGLPLTTGSDRAAACYVDGVDRMLAALHGADAAFDAAIAEDPDFAMAHIGRARVHQLNMEGANARAKAAEARQLAAAASPRERQHVEIMASVIESQARKAMTAAEQHLTEYPRDAQVLSLLLGAFGLYAFSGRADHDAARLAVCERYVGDYGNDWWFLTYLGWSQTEAGQVV